MNNDETNSANVSPEVNFIAKLITGVIILALAWFGFQTCSSTDNESLDISARTVMKQCVKSQLNYPETADFSLSSSTKEKFGENVYRFKGTLTAKNAFGVEQELRYSVTMTYLGGNPDNYSSWDITNLDVKENL